MIGEISSRHESYVLVVIGSFAIIKGVECSAETTLTDVLHGRFRHPRKNFDLFRSVLDLLG